MRKTIQKEIASCDICTREVSATWGLTKCERCAAEYCTACEGMFVGCIHQPSVCKQCAPAVEAIVGEFGEQLAKIVKARTKAIKETRKETRK